MVSNLLVELYNSTVALHERFNTNQTVQQSINLFAEEYNEVLDAASKQDKEQIAHEFVDCLVTIIGVFRSIEKNNSNKDALQALFVIVKDMYSLYLVLRRNGISNDMLNEPIVRVITKNNAKTLETHKLDTVTGKIQRIGK